MTAIATDDRQLVTEETIAAITPIEGADAIEAATVRGWTVVVRKDEFSVGDRVVYFEIDSLLPLDDERFAFLAPRGEKLIDGVRYHRLKTARLRGCYSQGLAISATQFAADFDDYCVEASEEMGMAGGMGFGEYLAATLGIVKYEEDIPDSAAGPFLITLGRKTSSDRVQNLAVQWPEILTSGPWLPVEKADGYSCSVFRDADGVLRVCGRNWEVPAPTPGNRPDVYWRGAHAAVGSQIIETFGPNSGDTSGLCIGEGIQFEIYGEGIRKNPLRVKGEHVAVFNFLRDGRAVPRAEWPSWVSRNAAPVLDLDLPATASDAIAQVEGLKSKINPDRLAEGVVWTQADARDVPALNYRFTMKAINNRYLLKNEG